MLAGPCFIFAELQAPRARTPVPRAFPLPCPLPGWEVLHPGGADAPESYFQPAIASWRSVSLIRQYLKNLGANSLKRMPWSHACVALQRMRRSR